MTKDSVWSLGGFTVLPDYDIESAPADFEGLILVGGMSWRTRAAKQVVPLVKHVVNNKSVIILKT